MKPNHQLAYILLTASSFAFAEEQISSTSAKFKTSFETLELPGGEAMGFLGGQFLYDVNPNLSIGPAAYGAATGDRGGFITLGGAVDASLPVSENLSINTGYFLGAGGGRGGYQLSGGGLMLRSHLGLDYSLGGAGIIGFGISNQDFPNGTISSSQPYLTYTYPFSTLITDGWQRPTFTHGGSASLAESEQDFSVVLRHYDIPAGVTRDNGTPQYSRIELVGAEWTRYLDQSRFVRLESEGAMGGRSNGYMQIFLGAGYRKAISNDTWLKGAFSLGVAGGGGVDTGGGILLDGQASIQHMLGEQLFLEAGAGYVMAPQAGFEALSITGKVGYKFATPDVGSESVSYTQLSGYNHQPLRIRAVNQTYQQAAPGWRGHHADQDVDNLGVQLDYFPTENFYLSGQGIAAYKGDAGAYMAGLVGAGVHLPLGNTPFYLEGEALGGAAGGGGLAVGGGLVWQANASLGYELTDSISLTVGAGRLEAVDGPLKANVISAGLSYKFGVPVKTVSSRESLRSAGVSKYNYNGDELKVTGSSFDVDSKRHTFRVENPNNAYWPQALAAKHILLSRNLESDAKVLEYEVVEEGHSTQMVRLKPETDPDAINVRDAMILPIRDIDYGEIEGRTRVEVGLENIIWFDDSIVDSALQSDLSLTARLPLSDGLSLAGELRLPILDDRSDLGAISTNGLDKVRSASFHSTSDLKLDHLYLESRGTANRYLHYRTRAGFLEAGYAGVGGEWLYWPYQSRLAAGLSAAYVKQRSPNDTWELAKYDTITGHASLYWALPVGHLDSALHLGRYLAKDLGATLELRRTLSNGWMVGAWGSYTDASEGDFGSDNTEHGIFLRIPFDVSGGRQWMQTRYDVAMQSTPRDAGARLNNLGSSIWWDLREARYDVFRGY
jgi:hypothetical protein